MKLERSKQARCARKDASRTCGATHAQAALVSEIGVLHLELFCWLCYAKTRVRRLYRDARAWSTRAAFELCDRVSFALCGSSMSYVSNACEGLVTPCNGWARLDSEAVACVQVG
jgi:hypothetical protein